ncbi:zinc finger BED domain-containing protein RICESLEEPER 2-like isoform X1 [Raphanus sativus]|uniref:Zinc finger BED domain-containing protein RICESLEEPER 2-like isoform X1 n=1 Tax=Raphanus sativus TaxID=3726 RepID=A0A9W3BS51_RAPSA|nr:zinc finger BED domain-containing protein RICESLEEPER 2-like isoform X1 [Raphanus sativus]XP_056842075.1 zinc finger BED domain-containing protein RICESLEEPER 2-like isoform X1 [Raphanus sativus]
MDKKSDIDSGSGSDSVFTISETMKNIDDSVEDTVDDLMHESEDDFEEEEEEDDDEDMSENESDGDDNNNPTSNWLGITPASIRKEVLKIHEERKVKAKRFLKDFQGKLTLSYDWLLLGYRDHTIAPVKHEDFTCLSAHFIDDDWKVRKWILGYTTDASIPMDDLLTYHFRTAVQSFEIQNKVSTILLPNDEDFDEKTVDAIKKYMGEEGLPVNVVYCCADLFRLMVDDLCGRFRWGLYEELRMLVSWGRCFSTPNWNVTLYHYGLALDMHKEDAFSKDEIYDEYDKPSDEEWVQIETYCKLGGCVYKVAKELFEEGGYSTCNVYFHLLAELKVMLKKEVDGGGGGGESDGYFVGKAKKMLKMFDKYWGGMFVVLAAACVLDPRFKMKYVEFYCAKKIDGDEGSKAETVLDYLRSLFARYAASEFCQKPICSVATVDHEEDEDDEDEDYGDDDDEEADKEEKEKPDAYKDFALFQEFLKYEGSSPREFGDSELDAYLKEPIIEWDKDFKALEWWKEKSQTYPVLSRVARDVLSIPVSRATSYDAYVTEKREPPESVLSMDAKAANAVMCGRSWLPLIK